MTTRGRPITLPDEALLDIARDVFLERGAEATTAEIAKRARISESVIFHRYKTKEALFKAVAERQVEMPEALVKLGSRIGQGAIADHLFDVGMGLIALSERMLPFVMIAFAKPQTYSGIARDLNKPHPMRTRIQTLLTRYVEGEIAEGRLRAVSPEVLVRAFLGGITQFVMSGQVDHAPSAIDAPTYLRAMIDVLLHGSAKIAKRS